MYNDIFDNIMLLTDSYKESHYKQYPKGTTKIYSYLESRGGKFDRTKFFGLQYIIMRYLEGQVVTKEKIDEAEEIVNAHFGRKVFNREGWEYILERYGGRLPVTIMAVPEGMVINTHNVLVTVENNDPNVFWLTNFLETLLVQVWYGITVATISYEIKQLIYGFLLETGDPSLLNFKLHDFGFRGVSSVESAGIGGCAHLTNFMGTDTIVALVVARKIYGCKMAGFSIPATEHSTITSWGRSKEVEAYANFLEEYKEFDTIACVSDSYDIDFAVDQLWGVQLYNVIMARKGTLVVRPDSGEPVEIIPRLLETLGRRFGFTYNAKGYKVLNSHVRLIQGDGVNYDSIKAILEVMKAKGWSADNIAFGMGGALLQQLNRDTQKFAFKCSYAEVLGVGREVFKQPKTDPTKNSKRGRLALVKLYADTDGVLYETMPEQYVLQALDGSPNANILQLVFKNGVRYGNTTLDEIRAREPKMVLA